MARAKGLLPWLVVLAAVSYAALTWHGAASGLAQPQKGWTCAYTPHRVSAAGSGIPRFALMECGPGLGARAGERGGGSGGLLELSPRRRTNFEALPATCMRDRLRDFFRPKENPANFSTCFLTCGDVGDWLQLLGRQFDPFIPTFESNAIDGNALLELTDEDLMDFGIANQFHRKQILRDRAGAAEMLETAAQKNKRPQRYTMITKFEREGEAFARDGSSADAVFSELGRQGIKLTEGVRINGCSLDYAMSAISLALVRLGVCEYASHFVMQPSAQLRASDPSVMAAAKQFMEHIIMGKNACSKAFVQLHASTNTLVTAISNFYKASVGRRLTDARAKTEIKLLQDTFQGWADDMRATTASLNESNDKLMEVASLAMQTMNAGAAVADNIEARGRLVEELAAVASQCQRMKDAAPPKVKYALNARSGALQQEIQQMEHLIDQLQQEKMDKQTQREKVRVHIENILLQIGNQTGYMDEIRDWHIKTWWKFMWEPDMNAYEAQVNRSRSERGARMSHAQNQIVSLEKAISDIDDRIVQTEALLAEYIGILPIRQWKPILAEEGILANEEELERKRRELQNANDVIEDACRSAGISDPEKAIQIIKISQQTSILLAKASETAVDATQRLRAWEKNFGNFMSRLKQPDLLPDELVDLAEESNHIGTTLFHISSAHADRMERLKNDPRSWYAAIKQYIEDMNIGMMFQSASPHLVADQQSENPSTLPSKDQEEGPDKGEDVDQ